ncbi:MAG TPA: hypothetical protein VJ853_07110 [Thermoanaerobaculia bacterium]|nr:hypothetical protein [Thermoanaerobaculia bacterium]
MKHGHKKGKAKATPSGKKSQAAAKSKASESRGKAAGAKAPPTRNGGGKDGTVTFNNPAVAAAFKRAVKKYSSTFRRLTD